MELTIEQALQRGAVAQRDGKVEEAARLWRAVLELDPQNSVANHNLGTLAVSENKISDALPFLKAALDADLKVEQFWLSYIGALIQDKQTELAKQVLEQAKVQGIADNILGLVKGQLSTKGKPADVTSIAKGPDQNKLRMLLEHYQSGRVEDAENLAVSMTKEFPDHTFAWKVLGGVYDKTDRMSDALYAHQITVALDPKDPDSHNNLGQTLNKMGRSLEAEESCRRAIDLKPEFAPAHNNLGNALHELGRLEEAESSFIQAIALNPQSAVAYSNLSTTLCGLGRFEEAETCCKQAIALIPGFAEAHCNLGNALIELQRLDEAKASYIKAISLKSDYVDAYLNLGKATQELGDLSEAESNYRKAIALKGDYAEAYNNLGVILKELGRFKEAVESCTQAIVFKPSFVEAYSNLGVALRELGRFGEAEDALAKALALRPDFVEGHTNLGIMLEEQGRVEESVSSFQNAFYHRTGIQSGEDERLAPATTSLFFELTNKCNFHCTFCPSDDQKRSIGNMDLELAKQLYEEAAEKKINPVVNLHLMGEPTLHPNLIEILNFGASKKIRTHLTTNGSTLVAKNVPKILDSIYGTVIASHMTPTEDTYHFRGEVGLSWDRYIGGIRLLVHEYMKRLASGVTLKNKITIRIMATQNTAANVIITDTPNEASLILKEWNEFVAEIEKNLGMVPYNREDHTNSDLLRDNRRAQVSYSLQKGIELQFWRAFTFANTRVGEEFELELQKEAAYCPKPFQDIGVLWNGDVTLCGVDHDGVLKVGNVKGSSIETVIQSAKARTLRASMLGRHPLPDVCKTCQANPIRDANNQS